MGMEKKKKKFKKLIGKLSRERRHAETTRIKQQRRKSNPFSKSQFYFDDDMDIVNYQETHEGMDVNLDLHVLPLENATPLCSDLLPPKTKEVDSAIEYEVASEDGVLEMDDELCLFRVDSLLSYKRLKSFSKPLSLDMEKKKKKFKKLIGKLSRERRHAETTRIKQQRRKSNPFSKSQFYFDDDMDIVNYQETHEGMDVNLDLHVLPLENATPLCSDLLPPKTKEVDSAIEYEVASEDGVLEMDD